MFAVLKGNGRELSMNKLLARLNRYMEKECSFDALNDLRYDLEEYEGGCSEVEFDKLHAEGGAWDLFYALEEKLID